MFCIKIYMKQISERIFYVGVNDDDKVLFEGLWPLPYGVSYNFYDIPHIYESPAYCISYATSLVFSSVIWGAENNVEKYLEVVSYGADHPLGYVAEQTGLSNPLDPQTVADVSNHFMEYCTEYFGW